MNILNKLECLSLRGISILVKGLWVSQEPTQRYSILGLRKHLALLANIRVGQRGLSGKNTLAYYEHLFQVVDAPMSHLCLGYHFPHHHERHSGTHDIKLFRWTIYSLAK
jgi:hypothetical protein